MDTELAPIELKKAHFDRISQLVYRLTGIHLPPDKQELVKARLTKRLRALRLKSFDAYMEYLKPDNSGGELVAMVEAMTTNKTSFFREPQHFDYLCRQIVPQLKNRRIRVWSAGCSSGEEPYSTAILLNEAIQDLALWDIRILATDLSSRMLAHARKGIYDTNRLQDVPPLLILKYFTPLESSAIHGGDDINKTSRRVESTTIPPLVGSFRHRKGRVKAPSFLTGFTCIETNPVRHYQVIEPLRRHVHFARLNLMREWPMRGPFDVIFCRNVMIYFDKPTQEQLVNRFWNLLKPGGHLFVGHSESLAGLPHKFCYAQPAIYVK
jgi:chemotaxis protein methyltransferase CheR